MPEFSDKDLQQFIINAKRVTYVGNGKKLLSYRLGSQDLQYFDGDWAYHDGYVGESDFMGEEIVYHQKAPVWGENYFGYILKPERITSAQAGEVIMTALSALYAENRFLGDFRYTLDQFTYIDTSEGDFRRFLGKEWIEQDGEVVYELMYHGGLIQN